MGRNDKCPICRKWFRSDACPHSFGEAFAAWQLKKTLSLLRNSK